MRARKWRAFWERAGATSGGVGWRGAAVSACLPDTQGWVGCLLPAGSSIIRGWHLGEDINTASYRDTIGTPFDSWYLEFHTRSPCCCQPATSASTPLALPSSRSLQLWSSGAHYLHLSAPSSRAPRLSDILFTFYKAGISLFLTLRICIIPVLENVMLKLNQRPLLFFAKCSNEKLNFAFFIQTHELEKSVVLLMQRFI